MRFVLILSLFAAALIGMVKADEPWPEGLPKPKNLQATPAPFPKSTDGRLQAIAKTSAKYDHKPCYQDIILDYPEPNTHRRIPMTGGVFALTHIPNRSVLPKASHTNIEFPWKNTAGHTGDVEHYVALAGPIYYKDVTKSGNLNDKWPEHVNKERIITWEFSPGTIFVELLKTNGKTFEVRVRKKVGLEWKSTVYRPYADWEDLAEKLNKVGTPEAVAYAEKLKTLERTPVTIKNPHPYKIIDYKGHREDLPPMSKGLVDTVLSWEFVAHSGWREDTHAPSTKEDYHIVPKDYEGFAYESGSKSCMKCHDTTGVHAFTLEGNRDWYGRVRGSDGIFSFHIFDESSISPDHRGKEIKFNKNLPLEKLNR